MIILYQIYGSSCTFTKVENEAPDTPEAPEVPEEIKWDQLLLRLHQEIQQIVGENRRPEITATFEDESGVDMATVKDDI